VATDSEPREARPGPDEPDPTSETEPAVARSPGGSFESATSSIDSYHFDEDEAVVREVLDDLWAKAETLRQVDWISEAQVLAEIASLFSAQLRAGSERDSFRRWVEAVEANADPATLAALYERRLVIDRPALGAFPRRNGAEAYTVAGWYRQKPGRLAGFVVEASRFGLDERLVLEKVAEYAASLEIADHVAEAAIAEGLRQVRTTRAGGKDSDS
jgi:hypothetical protein